MSITFLKENHKFPLNEIDPKIKPDISGWFTDSNKVLLYKTITRVKPKIILELGTWLGLSAYFICEHMPKNSVLISVDMWEGDASIGFVKEHNGINLYKQFLTNMQPHANRLYPIKMDGRKVLKYLSENSVKIDLIYLDMGHRYSDVLGDLKEILKYYKGVPITGDDFYYYSSTRKAVIETRINYKIPWLESDGNCYLLSDEPIKYKVINDLSVLKLDKEYKPNDLITLLGEPHMSSATIKQIVWSTDLSTVTKNKLGTLVLFVVDSNIAKRYVSQIQTAINALETIPQNPIAFTCPENNVNLMTNLGVFATSYKLAEKLCEVIAPHVGNEWKCRYYMNDYLIRQHIVIHFYYLVKFVRDTQFTEKNNYKIWKRRNKIV